VKRSIATEPVIETILASPPAALVISAHSALVEASIQIGAVLRDSSGRTWSTSGSRGDQAPASSIVRPR
jgi:hypothetical protein